MDLIQLIKMIWPVIAIQLGLQIYAIVDVLKQKKTRNLSPTLWIVIIVLGEILGPVIYLMYGRSEE